MLVAIKKKTRSSQSGIALAYVLAFLALVTLATTYMAKTQRGTAQSLANYEARVALLEQVSLIRGRIIGCAVSYPAGDNGTSVRVQYPATPTSTYVRDLTCPGQSGANNLWSGTGGLTLPSPPRIVREWQYANDGTSMRIYVSATFPGDPTTTGIMDAIAARIGSAAVRNGDVLTVTLMN